MASKSILAPLGGEADPNSWHFMADHGPLPNPVGHTFPLMSHDETERWRVIGTGFYVGSSGLFVTARHVIEDVLNEGQQIFPLVIFHPWSETGLFGLQSYIVRPIEQCWIGNRADIALGMAAELRNNVTGQALIHWNWTISWGIPEVGSSVATYAFPNHAIGHEDGGQTIHFRPDLYRGQVEEIANFRDSVMLPFPYMQVDFRIHGAASGGPVVGQIGGIVGVNCSENTPDGPAYVTQIRCLEGAFLDMPPTSGGAPRRVTFDELAASRLLSVLDYVPSGPRSPSGRLVRLRMPFAERRPILYLNMAF
jgi:hypothetical protein